MKKIRNQIDGVLLLNKPLGLSSNGAIQKVKHLLNAAKVGHTGTLDPAATGLLPVCLGEATKFASYLLDGNKEYIATIKLGVVTDSGDSEGNLVAINPVNIDLRRISAALLKFTGPIDQVPPMYSALKHNGRPLYEYARKGIQIERPARKVIIHELELVNYDSALLELTIRAKVSKGTYIRTLAVDIGEELGSGASLTALQRTESNQFLLKDAYSLDDVANYALKGQLPPLLLLETLCAKLPSISISSLQYDSIKYGNPVLFSELPMGLNCEQDLSLFAFNKFLGVGQFHYKNDHLWLCPKRMVII